MNTVATGWAGMGTLRMICGPTANSWTMERERRGWRRLPKWYWITPNDCYSPHTTPDTPDLSLKERTPIPVLTLYLSLTNPTYPTPPSDLRYSTRRQP